ncbi:hypothetical protein FJY71_06485, partial [candidate division WOR-3 bacterium]|nr:hypothetical protein [candidate division WOR-3 bacterium]
MVMPVGFAIVAMAGISPLTAQPFKNLYLPDTLGGCADFDEFILNPVMNQVYVWSDRSNTLGVLDAATAERHRPFWNIPPHAGYLSWTGFALNPNHNRLYAATGYGGNAPTDTFALVYDCSTRAIVDTLSIPGQTGSTPQLLSMNIPSNQVFWSAYSPSGDSYFSYVFDASTNELRTTVRKEWSAHHETRPRAFSCPRYAYILEEPLLFLDVALDSIDDSILPPPGHSFHQPLLVASGAERLFALACRLAEIRADRLYVIDCLNNQVLGEVQLPGEVTALAYNSANSKLYAACGKTYVIDAATVELTDSLDVSGHLFYNSNTNHLYVSVWGPDRGLCIYDGATNRLVTELQVPGYAGILVPSTNKLFLRDGGFNVVLIDCDRLALERCFKVAFVNQNLMWQPVTNRLYVNDVCRDSFSSILTVYDAHTLRPLKVLDFRGRVEPEEWFYDLAT